VAQGSSPARRVSRRSLIGDCGPIVAALKASPDYSNVSAKLFDVLESHSAITKGPVEVRVI
jgi:hypothetical protein